ncbi:nucleobase:cation symporter-2 family protein [Peptoniphilus equinus]|uniref:Nucleobase:cation symporter-2 family protein n=1 Tax=Peptoniphilus equinus TaxID=3016343 RepID=A0ABY7QWD2_9FIRM|nr:nucleobase:cation symporter-2 family protein [Peptoniphilus equinus]WBW50580.1 nucleobase:cation symporter-2 family protein [Peptoniphilus equinus]
MDLNKNKIQSRSLFDLDGKPELGKALPIAFQHLLAMIVGNTLPAIVLTGQLANTPYALAPDEAVYLIQAGMFIAAIATFLQLYPVLKVGAKLPVIMGVSFAYIPVLTSIGVKYGLGAVFGAELVGGIVAFLVGMNIKRLYKYFPPIVSGTVVLTIGLSLYSVALNYMAGGNGNPKQGDMVYWIVAFLTLAVVLICNMYFKGIIKLAAILVGIVAGYIASVAFGIVDFSGISEAAMFTIPKIMPWKLEFPIDAVITMSVMFVVNSIQAVGDLSSTTAGGLKRTPTGDELEGGIKANGISSIIGSVIGGLPTATYSQNVGIVSLTKVVSRYTLGITAGLILIAAFIPKFGALMLSVPQAVIGGATVTVFAQITMSGMQLITSDEMSSRNVTITGLGIALGMGIVQLKPEALAQFPEWFRMVFTSSPVVLATLVVFVLNLILPKKTIAEEEAERRAMDNK